MTAPGPMDNDYWRERYLELEETLGYIFEGFAETLEQAETGEANAATVARLQAAEKELATLRGSRLGRLQQKSWELRRRVARKVRRLRSGKS